MKKLIAVIIPLILCISFCIPSAHGKHDLQKVITATFGEMELIRNEKGNIIKLEGTNSYIMKPGKPLLPVLVKTFRFPSGTKIKGIECKLWDFKKVKVGEVAKAPYPVPLTGGSLSKLMKLFREMLDFLMSEKAFPRRDFSYRMGYGLDRDGKRKVFLTVEVFPVKYLGRGYIKYAREVQIRISLERTKVGKEPEVYDMLVIAPSEFKEALQPFIDYKNAGYLSTKLVTLNEIKNGKISPEDIKRFIKKKIEEWGIKYVLLVGSEDKLPACFSNIPDSDYESSFPSDLYYADIYKYDGINVSFASWDANQNGLYGEYPDDNNETDLYPDVYLGRLACDSVEEVTTVVDKIMWFEQNNVWKNTIIVCGGDTFPGDEEDIDEGEYANQKVIESMPGINATRLWASGKGDEWLSGAYVVHEVNKNYADFLDFSGHGNPTVWATHPHGRERIWIDVRIGHVRQMENEKLPIVNLNGCSCGKFTAANPCIAWAFVKKEGGGGIACFAASGIAYGYLGSYETERLFGWFEVNIHKNLYVNKVVGESWANTIVDYLNTFGAEMEKEDYKTVEEFILFGDPSLTKVRLNNSSPNKPNPPEGPTLVKVRKSYTYNVTAVDPDGDMVYLKIDWGDETTSGWLGPYRPGEMVKASHAWFRIGTYKVRVKAKDEWGAESEWSDPVEVEVKLLPKSCTSV